MGIHTVYDVQMRHNVRMRIKWIGLLIATALMGCAAFPRDAAASTRPEIDIIIPETSHRDETPLDELTSEPKRVSNHKLLNKLSNALLSSNRAGSKTKAGSKTWKLKQKYKKEENELAKLTETSTPIQSAMRAANRLKAANELRTSRKKAATALNEVAHPFGWKQMQERKAKAKKSKYGQLSKEQAKKIKARKVRRAPGQQAKKAPVVKGKSKKVPVVPSVAPAPEKLPVSAKTPDIKPLENALTRSVTSTAANQIKIYQARITRALQQAEKLKRVATAALHQEAVLKSVAAAQRDIILKIKEREAHAIKLIKQGTGLQNVGTHLKLPVNTPAHAPAIPPLRLAPPSPPVLPHAVVQVPRGTTQGLNNAINKAKRIEKSFGKGLHTPRL